MDLQFEEIRKAQDHYAKLGFSFTTTATLKCAIKLGIPDAIHNHGKPMTLSELTDVLIPIINPSKAPHIRRLMRLLVATDYFSEPQPNVYELTPLTRPLVKNQPLSLRPFALILLEDTDTKSSNAMSQWLQNDLPTSFETANGETFWEYCADQDKYGKNFDEVMALDSQFFTKILIPKHKFLFEGLTSMVDVGGGTGQVAKVIAKCFPSLKCTVLDQPHVVANLEPMDNLDFVGGDMFDKIPPANAIFLKLVLHDWNDEDSVKILKNCKMAIPEKEKGGKVIIVDTVLMEDHGEKLDTKDNKESIIGPLSLDIQMMVAFGAKERSENDWANLFKKAGFSGYTIFPKIDFRSPIEVYP